ncbi:nrps [Epichloe bromicola]|uniref:Nrps n=1 Tax=Epichloe bromicola TaxID=79588 RepID=A0ABQ0CVL9_9HYPO
MLTVLQFDVSIAIGYGKTQMELELTCRSSCLSSCQANRGVLLKDTILALGGSEASRDATTTQQDIDKIDMVSQPDLLDIWKWNSAAPKVPPVRPRTAAAFVKDPIWLTRGVAGQPGRHARLYKTGHLVRYDLNGGLTFVGRKDTQAKINGQRVELQGSAKGLNSVIGDRLPQLDDHWAATIPASMIPSAYVPIEALPMEATGKIDGRRLRAIAEELAMEELIYTPLSSSAKLEFKALQTFKDREGLTIFNEGHGRESWTPEIDPTRTVGWSTTITPIHLSRAAIGHGIGSNVICHVKDTRRRLVKQWLGLLCFQQLEKEDGIFESISLDVPEEGTSLPASTLFNINVSIEGGTANYSITYNRHIAHQGLINKWIDSIGTSLTMICEILASRDASRTSCDYEFLQLDDQGLDQFQIHMIPTIESINKTLVEDVTPCSPMVDGTLLSQIRDPK